MELHILNGDGTLDPFKESGIKGDVIVWREILSEGPVKNTSDEEFLQLRSNWIAKSYNENAVTYRTQVIEEYFRIKNSFQYDKIYLWFEHDLICQVNLVYLLNVLSENHPAEIYVIRFYEDDELKKKYKGFGAMNGELLRERFQFLLSIDSTDIKFARSCWETYAGTDPFKIESFLSPIPEAFPFLHNALVAHLKRFPSTGNGLNAIQQRLLYIIDQNKLAKNEIITRLFTDDYVYGLTDLISEELLHELSPALINRNGFISLSENGRNVFDGNGDFLSLKKPDKWIGGYHLNSSTGIPRWDRRRNRLIIC